MASVSLCKRRSLMATAAFIAASLLQRGVLPESDGTSGSSALETCMWLAGAGSMHQESYGGIPGRILHTESAADSVRMACVGRCCSHA